MIKKAIFLSCMLFNITYGSESTRLNSQDEAEFEQRNFIRNTVAVGILSQHTAQSFLPKTSRDLNVKIAQAVLPDDIPDDFMFAWHLVLPASAMRPTPEALTKLRPLHPEIVQMASIVALKIQEEKPFPPGSDLPFHLNRLQRYIETPFPTIE